MSSPAQLGTNSIRITGTRVRPLGGHHIGHHRARGERKPPEQGHGKIGSERLTSVRQALDGTTRMSTLS
jgi:hypothetical protein